MHSVRIELTKLILVGKRITYQATGDAGPYFPILFCFVAIVFLSFVSALLCLGLSCCPWPPPGHRNAGLVFVFSALSLPSFSFLVFRLVLTCRPSVGPSTGRIMGLIVPANSNLVPSGFGCALSACSFRFRFSFPFCFSPFYPYLSLLDRVL